VIFEGSNELPVTLRLASLDWTVVEAAAVAEEVAQAAELINFGHEAFGDGAGPAERSATCAVAVLRQNVEDEALASLSALEASVEMAPVAPRLGRVRFFPLPPARRRAYSMALPIQTPYNYRSRAILWLRQGPVVFLPGGASNRPLVRRLNIIFVFCFLAQLVYGEFNLFSEGEALQVSKCLKKFWKIY
jgi:hypothetical protein